MNVKAARRVLIGAVCINMLVGINYIWSIISKQLVNLNGWTSTQSTTPYMISLLMVSLMMIVGGRICDKGHPDTCATIGAVLFGGGLILCGLGNSPLLMALGFGFCQGIGNGLCAVSTTATAMKWYPAGKRGMISGICMAGFAFSSVYMSILINCLIAKVGISKSFLYAGIASLFILLIFARFLKAAPQGAGEENETVTYKPEINWRAMIRTSEFYKLWVIFILGFGGGLMIMGSIATIVSLQGRIENAALFVILIAVFNSLGRFTVGMISDRIGVRNSFFMVLALQLANMLLFRFYTTMPLLIVGTAAAGYAYGGLVAMNAPAASKFSVRNLAQNAAIINSSYGIGGLIMPFVAASIFDRTGSYNMAYIVSACMIAAAILINITYKEIDWMQSADSKLQSENRKEEKNIEFSYILPESID